MACPPFLISANASGWNPLAGCAARTTNVAPGVALRKRPRVATAPVPNVAQDASGCRLHNDGMARGRPCFLPQFPDPGQRLKPGSEIGWRIRVRHFAISGCTATQQGMAPQQRRGPAAGRAAAQDSGRKDMRSGNLPPGAGAASGSRCCPVAGVGAKRGSGSAASPQPRPGLLPAAQQRPLSRTRALADSRRECRLRHAGPGARAIPAGDNRARRGGRSRVLEPEGGKIPPEFD